MQWPIQFFSTHLSTWVQKFMLEKRLASYAYRFSRKWLIYSEISEPEPGAIATGSGEVIKPSFTL